MKEFSYRTRSKNLGALESQEFDIAIIGGGITGAGSARDASMRGLKVALIEERDFAFGTSSRSSKLVHGGIRYLENYEFGLVFEALNERRRLFEMAPHLVHPLRFLLPVYEGDRVGMFTLGLGMWAYDALALFEVPELHKRLNKLATIQKVPTLQKEGLLGAYEYSDAYMDDDRLVLETLRSANEFGAVAANYVKAVGADFENERVKRLICEDTKTGKKIVIRAKHFLTTVGPWTDRVASDLYKRWKPILRPSKGIHLTLDRKRLALNDAVVMSTRADKRIVFGIPRHEMIIIGTTDTDFKDDPANVKTTAEDVRYLLGIVDQYFPEAKIQEADIIASYAGVRPLVADDSQSESATSREHVILEDPRNITFVAGGKYTTYRHMASQIIDACLRALPQNIRDSVKVQRTDVPLNPLVSQENYWRSMLYIDRWAKLSTLSSKVIRALASRHGMETEAMLERVENNQYLADKWSVEAVHAIEKTMCLHLLDFYVRRTPLMLARRDHGTGILDWMGKVFQMHLGWSDEVTREEIGIVHSFIHNEFAWRSKL